MTTSDKQPTGWVVVDFEDDLCVFYAGGWYTRADDFECICPYPSMEEAARMCGVNQEPHPWPLPASVLARLKAKHPGQDWSQVPVAVADAPVEKLGRWVIESLRPVTDHRYRDKADWHGTADRVSLPWRRLADVQGFMQRNYWSPLDYRVVNLDDLPSPAVAEPSEVEKLRAEVEKLQEEVYRLTTENAAMHQAVEMAWRGGKPEGVTDHASDIYRLTRERDDARASVASVSKQLRREADDAIRERDEARAELAKARLSRLDEFAKAALPAVWASGGEDRTFAKIAKDALDFAQATIRAIDGAGGA